MKNAWNVVTKSWFAIFISDTLCILYSVNGYDKKSDEGSNSVRMRPENSGALKVVKK